MSHVSTLLERNARFGQERHRPLSMRPEMNTVVLSCLDARTDPAHFMELDAGEALVLRNADGRVTPAVEQELGMLAASGVDAEALALLAISDHDASLRDDLSRLRASRVVPSGITVTGLRYDPATGRADTRFVEVL